MTASCPCSTNNWWNCCLIVKWLSGINMIKGHKEWGFNTVAYWVFYLLCDFISITDYRWISKSSTFHYCEITDCQENWFICNMSQVLLSMVSPKIQYWIAMPLQLSHSNSTTVLQLWDTIILELELITLAIHVFDTLLIASVWVGKHVCLQNLISACGIVVDEFALRFYWSLLISSKFDSVIPRIIHLLGTSIIDTNNTNW